MRTTVACEKYTVRSSDGVLLEPGSYFVIRSTDLFASAGLWAYVHSMETVLEYASQHMDKHETLPRLRALAEQAAALAAAWQRSGLGRIPD